MFVRLMEWYAQENEMQEQNLEYLRQRIHTANSPDYIFKALGWNKSPQFNRAEIDEFVDYSDLNDRRLKEMEIIAGACANKDSNETVILEIGTAYGRATKYMSLNAPHSKIYTINIPPEEFDEGGNFTTFSLPVDKIGVEYRDMGCENVIQILENTLHWTPSMNHIDVAFIDGSHDSDFVYQDTLKVLSKCKPGSIIIWHDFNPNMIYKEPHIFEVCLAIDKLYMDGHLSKKMIHLEYSWVGIYVV